MMTLKEKINSWIKGFGSLLNSYPSPRMSFTERRVRNLGLYDSRWDELSGKEKDALAIKSDFQMVMGDLQKAADKVSREEDLEIS